MLKVQLLEQLDELRRVLGDIAVELEEPDPDLEALRQLVAEALDKPEPEE